MSPVLCPFWIHDDSAFKIHNMLFPHPIEDVNDFQKFHWQVQEGSAHTEPLFQQVMTPANKQEVNINDSRMRFHITSETSLPHQWRGCASATRVSWQYPCWWKPWSNDVLESLKNPTFHYSFSFGVSIHLTLTCRTMKRLIFCHGDASFYEKQVTQLTSH